MGEPLTNDEIEYLRTWSECDALGDPDFMAGKGEYVIRLLDERDLALSNGDDLRAERKRLLDESARLRGIQRPAELARAAPTPRLRVALETWRTARPEHRERVSDYLRDAGGIPTFRAAIELLDACGEDTTTAGKAST